MSEEIRKQINNIKRWENELKENFEGSLVLNDEYFKMRPLIKKIIKEHFDGENSEILYHATNSTWTKPEIKGLGFHAGTLNAAKDRMKSFRLNINPHIKMFKFHLNNPLYIGRDYRFHDDLSKVVIELYKDKIITKSEKEDLIGNIYSDRATFENLRKLLHDKYGYDGIIYRNNIEDRGSNSYIAFYPEQIEYIGIYGENLKENFTIISESVESDVQVTKEANRVGSKVLKSILENKINFELLGESDFLTTNKGNKLLLTGIKFNLNQIEKKYDLEIVFCERFNTSNSSMAMFQKDKNRIIFMIFDKPYKRSIFSDDGVEFKEQTVDDFKHYVKVRFKSWLLDDNIFLHEFVHYLDSLRYGKTYVNKNPKNKFSYFNSPEEFNAYTQEVIKSVLKNKKKFIGISFKKFFRETYSMFPEDFRHNVNEDFVKKIQKRLYKLYIYLNDRQKKI